MKTRMEIFGKIQEKLQASRKNREKARYSGIEDELAEIKSWMSSFEEQLADIKEQVKINKSNVQEL